MHSHAASSRAYPLDPDAVAVDVAVADADLDRPSSEPPSGL